MTGARAVRRFMASTRGVAGVEFAMIVPLLLLALLGFYDAGTAMAIYTKTRYATATLAQITNQYTTIHDTDMQQIMGATTAVMSPYASTPATVSVSQIAIDGNGKATVSWSTTLTPGASFALPTALAVPNSWLIYSQVSYTFTPVTGFFIRTPLTLSDSLYVAPRKSASISRISP
ncbi:MAG: TadE/TadG family type IV pilus assembly protein [Pseudomonadota bacterium]